MSKFSYAVMVLVVCSVVGVAYAKAVKIKALTPVGTHNPDADGMTIANYSQGNNKTEIRIAITDFLPNETYHIAFTPGIPKAYVLTNPSGNASSHHEVNFDVCAPGISEICTYVYIDEDGSGGRNGDGSEDRAYGCTPCPE